MTEKQKKGKIALERAERVAKAIVEKLSPYCERIEVAGSIRRRKSWVNDIDLVLIPSDLWNLHSVLMDLCRPNPLKMSGAKITRLNIMDIQVDVYFATLETWATLLLIRTGSTESNIRLCSIAKNKGWHLAASGDGLFNETGERIAGDTEASIFKALDLNYKEPWERE